jgi:hypothetical protein
VRTRGRRVVPRSPAGFQGCLRSRVASAGAAATTSIRRGSHRRAGAKAARERKEILELQPVGSRRGGNAEARPSGPTANRNRDLHRTRASDGCLLCAQTRVPEDWPVSIGELPEPVCGFSREPSAPASASPRWLQRPGAGRRLLRTVPAPSASVRADKRDAITGEATCPQNRSPGHSRRSAVLADHVVSAPKPPSARRMELPFMETLLPREVLSRISSDNKNPRCAGIFFRLKALCGTRTHGPLLTMEDSRCARESEEQRLLPRCPCSYAVSAS